MLVIGGCLENILLTKFQILFLESLSDHSDMFRTRAKGLHRQMWWKNCKVRIRNGTEKYRTYSNI